MLRKLVAGWICSVVVASSAVAQVNPVEVNVSGEIVSKYMWNGYDRVEGRGLDAGPVVQPRVDVGITGSPLRAHVAGSFVVNDDSELHEAVYGVSAVRAVSPLTQVSVGYNFYDDRVSNVFGDNVADVHEVYGRVELQSSVGVKPSVAVKYENPTFEGSKGFVVAVGEVSQSVPVVPQVGVGAVGVDLKWRTAVVYNSSVKVQDVEVVPSGVTAWQVGVAGEVKTGHVVVVPHVNYQVTLEDAVNDKNPFWAGVGVAYGF